MAEAEQPRLVLVDGSGYIFRAFFALPPLTAPDGTPVGAVYGFANMLWKLIQDLGPGQQIAVVFDKGRLTFRNELYEAYKANRLEPPEDLVPQFPLLRETTRAFSLPVLEIEGFEADDLIASYAKEARRRGQEVLIVSSDKDLMQLIGDGIRMLDPMKQKEIGPDEVEARFGVGPELVADALALAGDTSDNVPGVPGIGAKTAAQLLTEFGSLEALLEKAGTIKQAKRRENLLAHAEDARLSKRLVLLADDAPLPEPLEDVVLAAIDYPKLLAFARQHGFKSLAQRIEQAAASAGRAAPPGEGGQRVPEASYRTITDLGDLDALLDRAASQGLLALDTETTAIDVTRAELVGLSLAVEAGEGAYLPFGHIDEFGARRPGQLDRNSVLERLRPILADPAVLKIGHHLKYDLGVLARLGLELLPYDDTMMLSYVVDGGAHGHGLDELAKLHLEHETIPYEAVCGSGKKQITFDRVPLDKATAYAAEDAEVALRLWQMLKPQLAAERRVRVYEGLERPLVAILERMERTGIRVDPAMLRQLSTDFTARMGEFQDEVFRLAGRTFNLGSPKQLGEVLFAELGLAAGRKTRTGAQSTDVQVLEGLAAQGHELPRMVLAWRQLSKLVGTYTDALIEEIRDDGRVHTSYAMAATSTGRLSSNDPNLQNIPIRTEEGRRIRQAFVAEDGHVLISADYSQIELRILAHIADIGALKEAFATGTDIHAVTASQMFKVPLEQMDPLLRRNAKTINYGIIYGIGAWGLSQRLGIEFEEAKAYIEAYFAQYPGIRDYMDRAKAEAKAEGFVTTLFGRKCATPEIRSSNPARRGYAERAAINAPIQGSAADVIKRAMVRIDRALARSNLGARMLLQVHDELVFEVPEAEAEAAIELVREVMEHAADLSVPLEVDVGSGPNWDAAH